MTELRTPRRGLVGAAALVAAVIGGGLAGCGSHDLSAPRLDASVGPTFARLYADRQTLLQAAGGPVAETPARCRRSNAASPTTGAGDDWTCYVDLPASDGHIGSAAYAVTLHTDGCYTADGPAALVGAPLLTTPDGRVVTNPLAAFDGCVRAI